MLQLDNAEFHYEPYPIGRANPILDKVFYDELTASFPPQELFVYKQSLGHKYSLSEINNGPKYEEYVSSNSSWRRFHQYLKSKDFIFDVVKALYAQSIDLGLPMAPPTVVNQLRSLVSAVRHGRLTPGPRLSSRFEFSMLPATGGCIRPHTDAPQKLITLVISMIKDGEWDTAFGGGTEVLRPIDKRKSFNFMNAYLEFDEVETIRTFDFVPNQCLLFIKTFNSLHAVRPMNGHEPDKMRKTITINIERLD